VENNVVIKENRHAPSQMRLIRVWLLKKANQASEHGRSNETRAPSSGLQYV